MTSTFSLKQSTAHVLHQIITKPLWINSTSKAKLPQPVFISGPPRSGTTWILETLETMLNARRHWEPIKGFEQDFFKTQDKPLRGGGYRPQIFNATDLPELQSFIHDVMNDGCPTHIARLKNPNLSPFANLTRLSNANVTIVKFTASQRLIPWLGSQFENRGLNILRNPIATISSQIKNRPPNYKDNLSIARFNEQTLSRYSFLKPFYNKEISRELRLAINVCIDFCIPLHDQNTYEHHAYLAYEDLIDRPELFTVIPNFWTLSDHVQNIQVDSTKPSSTTKAGSNVLVGGDPRLSWKKTISDELLFTIRELMDNFGIDCYSEAPEFHHDKASILQSRKIIGYGNLSI